MIIDVRAVATYICTDCRVGNRGDPVGIRHDGRCPRRPSDHQLPNDEFIVQATICTDQSYDPFTGNGAVDFEVAWKDDYRMRVTS